MVSLQMCVQNVHCLFILSGKQMGELTGFSSSQTLLGEFQVWYHH